MKALEHHVDRLLLAISASPRTKARMREELLGHLCASHEAAVSEGLSNPVRAAVNRMGAVSDLHLSLQASVPFWERARHASKAKLQQWESDLDYTRRLVAPMPLGILYVLLATGAFGLLEVWQAPDPWVRGLALQRQLLSTSGMWMCLWMMCFTVTWAEATARRALRGCQWRQAMIFVALVGPAVAVPWCLGVYLLGLLGWKAMYEFRGTALLMGCVIGPLVALAIPARHFLVNEVGEPEDEPWEALV